jgi:hypothetical protein
MESLKLEKEARATAHFDFGSSADDLYSSKGKRNIRNEVNNKSFDPEAVIDAFEMSKGIKKKKPADMTEYVFKNIILDPEQQRDQDMLNELMNNKKYMITLWKDTWTNQGNYRVFIIYGSKKEEETK